jgi:hypothetical protein
MEEVKVVRTKLAEAKWIGAAAAVAVVVGLTVGGMAAIKVAGGGGAQPEDVLPANAIAFAKLDLNPSAGQKVAAYRLASRFPKVKNKVTSEDTSIKESIFGSIFTGPASKSGFGLDYKKDVEPWLGDRVGVAVFPDMDGDKKPEVGVAVAVKDEKAAKVALDKAIAGAVKTVPGPEAAPELTAPAKPTKTGYAFTDGYVILSDTTAHANAVAKAGKAGSLADSRYADDVKELDSDQIGVAWADIAAANKALAADMPNMGMFGMLTGSLKGAENASGRVVVGLHADPSFVEVTGRGIDLKGMDSLVKGGAGTAMIASFPAEAFGAVSVNGLGKQLADLYTSFVAKGDSLGVKSGLDEMGIRSAKEIETLFGAETGVVVGGTKNSPEVAVRTRGNNADDALVIARRLLDAAPAAGMDVTATKVTGPDGIVVGMGADLTAAVSNSSGSRLGGTEAFKQVIPDADKADYAAYVDLSKVIEMLAGDPKDAASMKPLKALGTTATGGAEPSFRLRVSVQ